MENQIFFLNMFPDYEPLEPQKSALSQAAIVDARIDPPARRVEMELFSPEYIPLRLLDAASREVGGIYGLRELVLNVRHPAAQLQSIAYKKQGYIALTAKLDAMSPLKVLSRGFALVRDENGELIRSIRNVEAGQPVTVTVSDGIINATITDKKERSK